MILKTHFSVFVRSGHHIANLRGGVHQLAGKIYADSEYYVAFYFFMVSISVISTAIRVQENLDQKAPCLSPKVLFDK